MMQMRDAKSYLWAARQTNDDCDKELIVSKQGMFRGLGAREKKRLGHHDLM
jgi:hypothetical protein